MSIGGIIASCRDAKVLSAFLGEIKKGDINATFTSIIRNRKLRISPVTTV
jgi:hypothetical protein